MSPGFFAVIMHEHSDTEIQAHNEQIVNHEYWYLHYQFTLI